MSLPALTNITEIHRRLKLIFPEGTPNRNYCVREMAANTVYVALYIGAVEGSGAYLGPAHVYRMSDAQATLTVEEERLHYCKNVLKRSFEANGKPWYADTSREPIRDETLRDGLVAIGAVLRREDLPTTSSHPRYSLKADFAALFDPALDEAALRNAITEFRAEHLSPGALARVAIMLEGAAESSEGVLVTFPNRETRMLAAGPSSIICRAVVEVFAPMFLARPAVLWLSESGKKVVMRDDRIAQRIGLNIQPDQNLPDLILADLAGNEPLLVFIEVVASDGAITARRQEAFFALTDAANFRRSRVAFVTAYQDRDTPSFKKTVSALAWGSFAWFVSEPDNIVFLRDGQQRSAKLSDLL